MEEQEELISNIRKDYEVLQSDMTRLQSDNDAAKDEVKEVLQVISPNARRVVLGIGTVSSLNM